MNFTSGHLLAFETLMKTIPGFEHFDSKRDGILEECRECIYHRPGWRDRTCEFPECPYQPGVSTLRVDNQKSDCMHKHIK